MPEQELKIGEKIKVLRAAKGFSIEEVAQKSGISAAVIAGIEELTVSPPLGTIISLANVFHVTLGDLFGDSGDSPFCIVRSDDRKPVSRFGSACGDSGGYSYESLGYKKQNRQMEPFLVTLNPGKREQVEPNQHAGEEILFVLTGQVEVRLSGHTDILNAGDSIYFDSNLPHIVVCHGKEPATLLAVIYTEKEMIVF